MLPEAPSSANAPSEPSSDQHAGTQQPYSWWHTALGSIFSLGSRAATSQSNAPTQPVEPSTEQRPPTVTVTPDAVQSETAASDTTATSGPSGKLSQAIRDEKDQPFTKINGDRLKVDEKPQRSSRHVTKSITALSPQRGKLSIRQTSSRPGRIRSRAEERKPRIRGALSNSKLRIMKVVSSIGLIRENLSAKTDIRESESKESIIRAVVSKKSKSKKSKKSKKPKVRHSDDEEPRLWPGLAPDFRYPGPDRRDQVRGPPATAKDPSRETIKQQLQQLFEQLKALQNALEEKTTANTSPSDISANAVTPRKEETAHRQPGEQSQVPRQAHVTQQSERSQKIQITRRLDRLLVTRKSPTRTLRDDKVSPEYVLARAKQCYRISTEELINVAHSLQGIRPNRTKPLLNMIENRLAFIARDAIRESDDVVESVIRRYCRWNAIIHALPAASLLRKCNNQYRKFALDLATIVKTLDTTRSPLTTHLASIIRRRLATMYEEAQAEGNIKLCQALNSQKMINAAGKVLDCPQPARSHASAGETHVPTLFKQNNNQGLTKQIHTLSPVLISSESLQKVSKASDPKNGPTTMSGSIDAMSSNETQSPPEKTQSLPDEVTDQSLLEELFPEASVSPPVRQAEKKEHYPKLDPPESANNVTRILVDRPKSPKELMIQSFQKRGEQVTVLQLEHCSTELTEPDFRRIIPKGEHIEAWNRLGAYYKIIPGRDPLSLERLPFYYLLFKSPESAHAYQKNAGRLHKLAALHQPSSIFSAIPAPKGFLEDGEDINEVTTSYLLRPTEYAFTLRTLMQPYDSVLRTLIEQGGYKPIVPEVDSKRNRIYKVLMYIEGYEPSISDLFKTLRQDAFRRGMPFTLRNESSSSVHRLRDLINLTTHTLPISSSNPRAHEGENTRLQFEDKNIAAAMKTGTPEDTVNAKEVNQMIMNRVYNRWILDFDDENEARRFAISWHRRVLPDFATSERTWKDYEEVRMCNTELLW